jgi:hypothetical protein
MSMLGVGAMGRVATVMLDSLSLSFRRYWRAYGVRIAGFDLSAGIEAGDRAGAGAYLLSQQIPAGERVAAHEVLAS